MQRRTWLKLGIASATVLAVGGGALALLRPGLRDGRFSDGTRAVFRGVGQAVLEGLLPAGAALEPALQAWLGRLEATIAAFPPATRAELSQLLGLLSAAPGRRLLAGLEPSWETATVAQVQAALQGMRTSPHELRQQAYHGLRDLTMAAYFAGPETWSLMGYPGPSDI